VIQFRQLSRAFLCAERKPGNIPLQFQPYVSHGLESRCCDIKYKCVSILHPQKYVRHDVTVNSYIFSDAFDCITYVSDNVSICTVYCRRRIQYQMQLNRVKRIWRRTIRRTAISVLLLRRRINKKNLPIYFISSKYNRTESCVEFCLKVRISCQFHHAQLARLGQR